MEVAGHEWPLGWNGTHNDGIFNGVCITCLKKNMIGITSVTD